MTDRIFVEWSDGTWLSSGRNPDFQANLAEMVAQSGPPSKVEFRAAGEGYLECTGCDDCGKPFSKCRCDGYDPDETVLEGRPEGIDPESLVPLSVMLPEEEEEIDYENLARHPHREQRYRDD